MEPRPHERGKSRIAADLSALTGLQWSHVLTNVERPATRKWPMCAANCFNGATSSRTWKAPNAPPKPPPAWASMEPRPHERGKMRQRCHTRARRQCFNGATSSRTWKAAFALNTFLLSLRASMEPRPHERGKSILPGRAVCSAGEASMEPRPHERGKKQMVFRNPTVLSLQWSHVLTNVERTTRGK